ncbi:MAG: insulinase family protein [Cephaloticoccus sp.]|nr:insulinase family protein [Cephaloticoccus sp.]
MPSANADLALLNSLWRDDVSRQVLPNGLTLLVRPDPRATLASVQVWVKTGSIHESGQLGAGLSHYLEHMLFKGTTRRTGRDLSTTVQAHGGYINAYTTFDRTVYYIDIPAEHMALAVDVLGDMVLHSTLPADEVRKEKDVILREIAMGQDEPDHRLAETLFATAFREHPYAHPIIGHRDVFSAVTRKDILAYYHARYVPNNLVVVVVGDVNVDAVRAAVDQHFGAVPRARLAPVFVPEEQRQLAPRQVHCFEKVELSRAGLAWQIPGLIHPDTPALDVLAMILGAGDSSVLWQQIREKAGLVHSIDATCWNPGSTGLIFVSFTSDPDKREAATTAIGQELVRLLRRGFTVAQIRKAVRQLVVGEINTRKTMSGQASRLGIAEVVVGDLHFSQNYFKRLTALQPRDLKRVMRQYIIPEGSTCVSLNPAKTPGSSPVVAAQNAGPRSDFELINFPNGTRLLLQPDHSLPNIHLRVCCLGGPSYEASDRRGATALLATLLTKDTKGASAASVARKIEEVGGSFYPFSGNNTFGLALEVLPPDMDRAWGVLSDALLQPAFRPVTVAMEREAQLASIKEANDSVVSLGGKILRKKFFGLHPFAIDAQGEEQGLGAVTPVDLIKLYRRLLRAGNVVLVVAGDFSPAKVKVAARKLLMRVPAGKVEIERKTLTVPSEIGKFIEIQPRQQAVVYEAYPAPSLLASDFCVGEVMDELFSGMSSRLFERVRDELGLAYFVRSARIIGLDTAMFYFYAGTAPGSENAVLREIAREIKRVTGGGVEPEELQRCQIRLKAAHRMSMQTNSSRAMQAGLNMLYGQPLNDWKNYDSRIDQVSLGDLAKFARTYFRPGLRTQLTVRP